FVPGGSAMPLAWTVVVGVVAALGFWRGLLFSNEIRVMIDAVQKAPGNAWSHGQLANALYPEWRRANDEKRFDDRQRLARTIGEAARRAAACPNFADFYVTPAPLLVMAGEVLQTSGFDDEA